MKNRFLTEDKIVIIALIIIGIIIFSIVLIGIAGNNYCAELNDKNKSCLTKYEYEMCNPKYSHYMTNINLEECK